jgi:hypothetical protein
VLPPPASEPAEKAVRQKAEATVSGTCSNTISGHMKTYLRNKVAVALPNRQDPQSAIQAALEKASSEGNTELAVEAVSFLAS